MPVADDFTPLPYIAVKDDHGILVGNDDTVNHPSHYTSGSIECIDAIESSMDSEAFAGYLKGNILKYIWRYKNKNNPLEDLKKAEWYLNKLITHIENKK